MTRDGVRREGRVDSGGSLSVVGWERTSVGYPKVSVFWSKDGRGLDRGRW